MIKFLFLLGVLARGWCYAQTALLVAEWNFWIGSVVSVATALAGWYAYNTVAHDIPSHTATPSENGDSPIRQASTMTISLLRR